MEIITEEISSIIQADTKFAFLAAGRSHRQSNLARLRRVKRRRARVSDKLGKILFQKLKAIKTADVAEAMIRDQQAVFEPSQEAVRQVEKIMDLPAGQW